MTYELLPQLLHYSIDLVLSPPPPLAIRTLVFGEVYSHCGMRRNLLLVVCTKGVMQLVGMTFLEIPKFLHMA